MPVEKYRTKRIRENMDLVKAIVNNFYNKIKSRNPYVYLEKEDLLQEGLIGLFKAIKTYKTNRNIEFGAHARKNIRWGLYRYLETILGYRSNIIIKPHTHNQCNRVLKYQGESDVVLTSFEIGEALNISPTKVSELRRISSYLNMKCVDVNECEEYLLPENNYKEPLDTYLRENISDLLDILRTRERYIIEMYFGLGEFTREHTLEELSVINGVSKERIRQIVEKSTIKLRTTIKNKMSYLKEYLNN
jgi:RNA polymerase primary sigma factor